MWRLVVTANRTGPICARIANHAAASASAMRAGPATVPPGRLCCAVTGSRSLTPHSPVSSMRYGGGESGKVPSRRLCNSATLMTGTSAQYRWRRASSEPLGGEAGEVAEIGVDFALEEAPQDPGAGKGNGYGMKEVRAGPVVVGLGRHQHQVQPGPGLHEAEAVLESNVEGEPDAEGRRPDAQPLSPVGDTAF